MTEDGTAILSIIGPLTKYPSSFQDLFGGSAYVDIRRGLRDALDDEAVKSIVLQIDSPGGLVAGLHDLADDVRAATERKRTVAFIEDLGASAAYNVASQASEIIVNRSAMVGSIGAFAVVEDTSKVAERVGVKVHVLSTGFMKGAAVPGSEITDEQLADFQRIVDSTFGQFRLDVMSGRKLSRKQIDDLSTGQVWIGEDAVQRGLADRVGSLDSVLADLRSLGGKRVARRVESAAERKRRRDVEDSKARMAAARDRGCGFGDMKPKPPAPAPVSPPAKPADPIDEWEQLVNAKMRDGLTRQQAVHAAQRENNVLHSRYLAACREAENRQRVRR